MNTQTASALLPGGDPAEYRLLLDDLNAHFVSGESDLTELRCIREMADAEWRLRRTRAHHELIPARTATVRRLTTRIAELAAKPPLKSPATENDTTEPNSIPPAAPHTPRSGAA